MATSRKRRIPEEVYRRVDRIGNIFGVPNTKAFILREKILLGDFKATEKKKKGRNGKVVFEIEF